MIKGGTGGANTLSGAYFEQITRGEAPGIPLHKKKLGAFYKEKTGKHYSLSLIRPGTKNGVPVDKAERAKMFEGKFLLTKALEPDEAYLDYETSTLTIFEKKFQNCEGSVDEKIQTSGFKMRQYERVAKDLGIENVYYVYILGDFFKNPYYQDALDYIRSIPNCDYFFASDNS